MLLPVLPDYARSIEERIGTQVAAVSGLPVIWEHQRSPRPQHADGTLADHCGLLFTSISPVSPSEGLVYTYDAARSFGAEVERHAIMQLYLHLSIQCYRRSVLGSQSAYATLSRVRNSFGLLSVQEYLGEAGVGVGDSQPIQNISELLQTEWESRAQYDLTLISAQEQQDAIGYIQQAIVQWTSSPAPGLSTIAVQAP